MKLKNQPLHRLNEVSEKWRSVSFTDAVVHCPDFGSKSKFCRSRPNPIICGRQQRGPRRWSFFYFILTLNKKLIKKVVFTDKFDDDIQKVTPARAPLAFSFFSALMSKSFCSGFDLLRLRAKTALILAACHIHVQDVH
ncbi:hypothetical protein TNCV_975101 [Trichonephila clavipes]|nr:hypothetical protein TNCV_975101 [Trichonephila clavipes]